MKHSQKIQEDIRVLRESLAPSIAELDALYTQFGNALSPRVETWMNGHVRRKIEDHAATINSNGVEKVRAVKADFTRLVERLPALCTAAIESTDKWPHNIKHKPSIEGDSGVRSNETHAEASFRRAIAHLAPILEKHGILAEKKGHSAEWQKSGTTYRYAINPGFDARWFPVLEKYQATRVNQKKQVEQIETLIVELEKAKAVELWDES
jgi:hypothetical protein